MATVWSTRPVRSRPLGILPSIGLVATATTIVGWVLALQAGWQLSQVLIGLAGYAVLGSIVAAAHARHLGEVRFGLPNQITLLRAGLVCLAGGALAGTDVGRDWSLPVLVAFALGLDLVDGWIARRLNRVSAFGARFDMEVDTLLLLILTLLVWQADQAGAWVVLIGLLRYGFVLAGLVRPELQRPLYPSLRRRALCGVQGTVLLICLLPIVDPALATALAAGALLGLTTSFAIDVGWLLNRTPVLAHRLD